MTRSASPTTADKMLARVRGAYAHLAQVDRPEVWIRLRPQSEAEADALHLARRLAEGLPLPLAGLIFAVKDNIDVAGLPTTAAAPSYAYHPVSDATAVARLRRAVAIVIGKTNLDQFTRAGGHPLPLDD